MKGKSATSQYSNSPQPYFNIYIAYSYPPLLYLFIFFFFNNLINNFYLYHSITLHLIIFNFMAYKIANGHPSLIFKFILMPFPFSFLSTYILIIYVYIPKITIIIIIIMIVIITLRFKTQL